MLRFADYQSKKIYSSIFYKFSLSIIVMFALLLRIFRLRSQPIWFDEAHTYLMASQKILQLWKEQVLSAYPPLYFIFMHFWIEFAGKSDVMLRLPSVIAGILSIPLVYFVGSRMFNKRIALISSLLAAISCNHLYYSQEARVYTFLAAVALLSGYYFYRMLLSDSLAAKTKYVLSTVLCLYLHNYGIFIWLAQIAYLLFRRYFKEIKIAIPQLLILIAFVPRTIVLFQQMHMDINAYIARPNLTDFIWTISQFVILSRNMPVLPMIKVIAFINICLFALFFSLAIKAIKNTEEHRFSLEICLFHTVVPVAVPILISYIKPIYVAGRYEFVAFLFFILIIGKGITCIRLKRNAYLAIVVILASSLVCQYNYFYTYRKSNNQFLNAFIRRELKTNDVIIFTNLAIATYHYYFGYNRKNVFPFPRGQDKAYLPKEAIEENEDFCKNEISLISETCLPLISADRRLFLFYNSSSKMDRMLLEYLKNKLFLKKKFSIPMNKFDRFEITEIAVFSKNRDL